MRIAIITRNSNSWVFKLIWELSSSNHDLLIINQKRTVGKPPWRSWDFIRRRGLFTFLDLWLQSIVAELARVKRRSNQAEPSSSREIRDFNPKRPSDYSATLAAMKTRIEAGERSCDWWNIDAINSRESIDSLREWGPEIVLLCGAPIIRKRFFRQFPTVINPHCGIVPEYKGSSPLHWAVYRRDFGRIGFTIHLANPEIDGGPVLEQRFVKLRRIWDLRAIDWFLVYSMYTRLVELILSGELIRCIGEAAPQQASGTTWPPMGFLRTWLAERRLRSHLAGSAEL